MIGIFAYAASAPRMRVIKASLLEAQKLVELSRAETLDEIVRLLKETRYARRISSAAKLQEVSEGITRRHSEDLAKLSRVSASDAREIVALLLKLEELRAIFTVLSAYSRGGPQALSSIPAYRLTGSALEIRDHLASSREERRSPRALVKRALAVVKDELLRSALEEATRRVERTESLRVIEAMAALKIIEAILEAAERASTRLAPPPRELVGPLLDYIIVQMLADLWLFKELDKEVVELAAKVTRGRLSSAVKSLPAAESPLQLYQALLREHGLPAARLEDLPRADEHAYEQITRLIRSRARRVFASYPLTPSLGVAAFLLLLLEYRDLMMILASRLVGRRPFP
ncbi:MAG: V-type ATPase subunit [Fervidicoccaceae archaeon]